MVVPAMVADLGEAAALFTAAYIEVLTRRYKAPTVKQHLAAMCSTGCSSAKWSGRILPPRCACPKHVVKKGKTPVLDGDEARKLLESIDTSTVVGLRDRALDSCGPGMNAGSNRRSRGAKQDTGRVDLHVGISVDGDGNLQRVDKSFLEMVEPLV